MNPNLDGLQPYPFERLNALLDGLEPNPERSRVALSIGEPKHAAPDFVVRALTDQVNVRDSLATYPPTRGSPGLRSAIAGWIARRFGAVLDPEREVLPVNGTREALFSFGQAVLSGKPGGRVLMPNPFYQIYEGAALLRGARPYYVPATEVPRFRCRAADAVAAGRTGVPVQSRQSQRRRDRRGCLGGLGRTGPRVRLRDRG